MALQSFNAYHSYLKSIEPLSDAERGRLFTALLEYSGSGTLLELRGNERFIFPTMKEQIDRDKAKYAEKCSSQREKALKRWYAGACSGSFGIAEYAKDKDKEKDKEKEKDEEKKESKKSAARFSPPSVAEVAAYCRERGNTLDAQRFVDFYASKGWRVGNSPMKDWQAAIRTWEQRAAEQHSARPGSSGFYAGLEELLGTNSREKGEVIDL